MQGDPVRLLDVVNQITTLEDLSLDLRRQQPPVHGEDPPAIQLRLQLPNLGHLKAFLEVGSMDVRSCPVITECSWDRAPVKALEAADPQLDLEGLQGLPPAEQEAGYSEWLHAVWKNNPGPYGSCPQDGIAFASEGYWCYKLCEYETREMAPASESPWYWSSEP